MKKTVSCAVIVITHNSEKFIYKCLESIENQTVNPKQLIIVDTGSKNLTYLKPYQERQNVTFVIGGQEIGFCRGNNIGFKHVQKEIEYVLLLNPDAFLFSDFLEKATLFMDRMVNQSCAVLTGKVLGYDIDKDLPSGFYDTTGIFQKWYGNWYDRGQGEAFDKVKYGKREYVPAICGALMFCRKKAIDEVLLHGEEIFDSRFFMYKEDIDLSIRLRKKGWKLVYAPDLSAHHCRGWNPSRRKMPRKVRLLSARNELMIHLKNCKMIGIVYSIFKYIRVTCFNS